MRRLKGNFNRSVELLSALRTLCQIVAENDSTPEERRGLLQECRKAEVAIMDALDEAEERGRTRELKQ